MELKMIDGGQAFDFGKTAAAYARYRDIYPDALYDRLRALGVAADGTAWLDLGTGTGVLPKHLYNPGASITGVDISAEQIEYAKADAAANGQAITYLTVPAEATGLPGCSFDSVTAAQCFFYFDREKMKAELRRLLKPGGQFLKIFMDWEETDPVAAGSLRLVRRFNPQWRGGAVALRDMEDDLFPGRRMETFDAALPFTRESWHGRMLACRGTLASMDPETLRAWEAAHRRYLEGCPVQFTVRHRVWISRFRDIHKTEDGETV